jgi:hypothetical protein
MPVAVRMEKVIKLLFCAVVDRWMRKLHPGLPPDLRGRSLQIFGGPPLLR